MALAAGCGGAPVSRAATRGAQGVHLASPATPPQTVIAEAHTDVGEAGHRDGLRARWLNVRSTAECFFAVPGDLGRDDSLGQTALLVEHPTNVALAFGDVVFLGQAHPAGHIALHRTSQHSHGNKWEAEQTIGLTASAAGYDGHYRYTECDLGNVQSCPGQCTIDADLELRP